jgi:ABC-type uncharacterized transport system involved in gliding motility auxiliary subunit
MFANRFAKTSSGIVVLIVALFALNIISSRLFGRVDVTEDSIYSLSEGTEKILEKLDGDVTLRLYFSRSIKELPASIKNYASRVEEVLNEYASLSDGKVSIEVVDPEPDTDEEEWARKYGIQPARLPQGSQLFFGAVLLKGSQEVVIPYIDPRREEFLEYDISEAFVGLSRKSKSKIGIVSSFAVLSASGSPYGGGGESWALASEMQKNFDVESIPLEALEISNEFDTVIVVHPKGASEKFQYALDQYVMRGGKLIIAVDPMSRFDLSQNRSQPQMGGRPPSAASDLPKLFGAWDVTFSASDMVGDVGRGSNINAGGQVINYPFFMSLRKEDFSSESVITNNLNQILFAEGGSFKFKSDKGYKFETLLKTSVDSGVANSQMVAYVSPADLAGQMKVDADEHILAGLLTGTFKSAFDSQPAFSEEEKKQVTQPHKAVADAKGAIVLIGDVDFLTDGNSVSKMRFAGQVIVQMRNDNLNLVFNSADFLAGSQDLISIRSSGKLARPFTKVSEIQKDAQFKWKKKEEKLSSELKRLQEELGKLQKQRTDGNRFNLSAEQQKRVKQFREEERKIRKERRVVRKNLREDIEKLGNRLIAINMFAVPFLVSGLGISVMRRRSKLMKKDASRG